MATELGDELATRLRRAPGGRHMEASSNLHRHACDALRRRHDLVSGSDPPTGAHVAAYRIELAGLGDYTPQRLSETRALAGARWYPAGRAAGGHPGR